MQDAWRAYLELALGLTEASKRKAQQVTKRLINSSGATAAQLQAMAEDLMSMSAANREGLAKLVRAEVDRALNALGVATADDLAALSARVRELEQELADARALAAIGATGPVPDAGGSVGDVALATALNEAATAPPPAAVKSTAAKKTTVKKVAAKKTAAKKAAAKTTVAKAGTKAVAKMPTKSVAKTTRKAVAKRETGPKTES